MILPCQNKVYNNNNNNNNNNREVVDHPFSQLSCKITHKNRL